MIREQAKIGFERIVIATMVILITAVAFSCGDQKPKGILSKKEMIGALIQIYTAEEKLSRVSLPYDSMRKLSPLAKERIFQMAGISDSTFRVSWNYYMEHPQELEEIYTAVIDSLNLKEQGSPRNKPE